MFEGERILRLRPFKFDFRDFRKRRLHGIVLF
jgi:hypothetical protein